MEKKLFTFPPPLITKRTLAGLDFWCHKDRADRRTSENAGHGQGLNLRDNGLNVIVGTSPPNFSLRPISIISLQKKLKLTFTSQEFEKTAPPGMRPSKTDGFQERTSSGWTRPSAREQ